MVILSEGNDQSMNDTSVNKINKSNPKSIVEVYEFQATTL